MIQKLTLKQHRWTGPSLPSGYGNWVTGNANKILNLIGLAPGSYTYTFHARSASDTSCATSVTRTVVIHPAVATPTISYNVISCEPYVLRLTASGPNSGTYNWSNGMIGETIEVTHGGAYSVTYTETSGCTATGYFQAPHNPESSLWVVPTGCYTICDAYLLGPLGRYQYYQWQVNGTTTQSGSNSFIPNQSIFTGGTYQLLVEQDGCVYESNTPNITRDLEQCPQRPCEYKAYFKLYGKISGGFVYDVSLNNPSSSPITIHLSSYFGYGTFVPAVHVLNPGFNTFTVEFHVNGTYYPGAVDIFVISGPDCADEFETKLEETDWNASARPATLSLSPNPATETTVVSFDLGTQYQQAESLTIYDLMGVQRYKQKLHEKGGTVTLNVSYFVPGTYLISLEADGKRIATEKLIKN